MKLSKAVPPRIGTDGHGSNRQQCRVSSPQPSTLSRVAAFTMVEIALCLAIIGFALLAVIAVLPLGLQVQRENREETIINQDASVWLDSLRSGARGYDDLTNFVDAITNVVTRFAADGTPTGTDVCGYTWFVSTLNGALTTPQWPIINGFRIVGLLSTPKYSYHDVARQVVATSNHVVAYVRAMSGAATEKFPQDNASVRDLAFRYRLVSEVVPYAGWDASWVSYGAAGLSPEEVAARSNYWWVARNLSTNLHEVRLIFRWPLLPGGATGNGRQVFRTTVSGVVTNFPPQSPFYFVEPWSYVQAN